MKKRDLTGGRVIDHLIRLAVPMTAGIFAVIGAQVADMYFVSLLGSDALAALTFAFPVTMFAFYLIMGLGAGTSSVVSRLVGAGDDSAARRVASHAVLFALVAGLAIGLIGAAVAGDLFALMGAKGEVLSLVQSYIVPWLLGSALMTISLVCNAAMRAFGDARTPGMLMIGGALLNLAFDPLLIFGFGPVPRFGLMGAAGAAVAANLVTALAGLYVLGERRKILFAGEPELEKFVDSVRRLLHVGLPSALSNTIAPMSHAVIVALLAGYGAGVVAAYGVVVRVEAVALIVIMSTAVAIGPVVGQNWGARQYARVHEAIRKSLGFFALWSLAMAAVLALFGEEIARLFTSDAAIVATARLYFLIVPATYALGTLVNGWSSALNAIGHPGRSMAMVAARMLILQVPLAVLLGRFYGAAGVFAAIAAANAISGTAFHILNTAACRRYEKAKAWRPASTT